MKPRKNPTDAQYLRRMQHEPIGPHDPRVRNDAYWALRHQGYSDAFARRAFRDMLPRFYREKVDTSGEYIDDIDPDELLFVPRVDTEVKKLAVMIRPDLTEESAATAAPRSNEYTIWSETVPGFGLRIRSTGVKTYIVMFRVKGRSTQGKITLGKPGDLSLDLARRLAREIRIEASAGNDPRPAHKHGELLKRVK
ncbi:MAG: Arm DNA-binding domain-containing protein [Spirochaetales bacterium]|nr:Arm DNA-binding domain-containing protein [Spirochaetales bacterium]